MHPFEYGDHKSIILYNSHKGCLVIQRRLSIIFIKVLKSLAVPVTTKIM